MPEARSRARVLALNGALFLAVLVALDVALTVVRVAWTEYQARAERARWLATAPPEVEGPPFVSENLMWRYIEFFTMRPGLEAGPEYRMDSFGLRVSRDGRVSFDRYHELACRKLWFFGGSTVMGLGLPADATLPALVQARLNGAGWGTYCVFNLGMGSQESTQELLLFYEMLQQGFRPDAVVFYDGINEAVYERAARGPSGTQIWQVASGGTRFLQAMNSASPLRLWGVLALDASGAVWLAKQVRQAWRVRPPATPAAEAALERRMATMVERYRTNVRLLRGMAADLGVKSFFFWQPAMAYDVHANRRPLTERERVMWEAYGKPDEFRRQIAFARARSAASFDEFPVVDVTDVFAGVREQVYMDPRHPNSAGNARIADRLVSVLRERL